jgi:hypothetical protein
LGRIMEEDRDDYYRVERRERSQGNENREGFSDHERWSEEAEEKMRSGPVDAESEKRVRSAREEKGKGKNKKTVAVVVSAASEHDGADDEDAAYHTEHAVSTSPSPFYRNHRH